MIHYSRFHYVILWLSSAFFGFNHLYHNGRTHKAFTPASRTPNELHETPFKIEKKKTPKGSQSTRRNEENPAKRHECKMKRYYTRPAHEKNLSPRQFRVCKGRVPITARRVFSSVKKVATKWKKRQKGQFFAGVCVCT